jgi:hypothetical protein
MTGMSSNNGELDRINRLDRIRELQVTGAFSMARYTYSRTTRGMENAPTSIIYLYEGEMLRRTSA